MANKFSANEDSANKAANERFCEATTKESLHNVVSTFKEIGLRSEKRLSYHLLLENTYENNLLSDISNVDYTKGNLGPTDLEPLEGLEMFIDDIYVYGYLSRSSLVDKAGKVLLSTGENGHAKRVVGAIQMCVGASFGTGEAFHSCSDNSNNTHQHIWDSRKNNRSNRKKIK